MSKRSRSDSRNSYEVDPSKSKRKSPLEPQDPLTALSTFLGLESSSEDHSEGLHQLEFVRTFDLYDLFLTITVWRILTSMS